MPNASVNIGGDASGALAAVAAAQGALDGLSGKTVVVDISVRGGDALGAAAKSMGGMASAAGRAERATRGLNDNLGRAGRATTGMAGGFARAGEGAERAGRAARVMGETLERAGGRMGAIAGHAERVQRAIAGGANNMRAIEASATSAGRGMRELESGAGRAAVAVRNIAPSGGGRVMGGLASDIIDMQKLEDGTWGVAKAAKAIEMGGLSGFTGQARAGRPPGGGFAGSSFRTGETPGRGSSHQYGDAASRIGDIEDEQEARRTGRRSTGSSARAASSRDAARAARDEADGIEEVGKASERTGARAGSMSHGLRSFEHMIRPAQELGFQMAMVGGMMAGVTREASKLMDSTTGMGLNFKGMAAGITQAEQSAARSHNLGLSGLDQELRQSARAMTNELAPAMKAGVQATKSFEEAKMGAQASMGPAIEGFANQLTQSSPQLQSIMGSLGKSALNLGTDIVSGLAQSAPAFQTLANSVAQNAGPITKMTSDFATSTADLLNFATNVAGAAEKFDKVGTSDNGNIGFTDPLKGGVIGVMRGRNAAAGRDPGDSGSTSSPLLTGTLGQILGAGSRPAAPRAAAARAGGFDPSKPFSGSAVMPDGSGKVGPGEPTAASTAAAGGAYHRSPDAAKYDNMSAKQIYDSQFKEATGGYSSTGPMPTGHPTTNFGSGVRPMPASIAPSLGTGSLAPLNDMMGAAQSQVASGGADTGQAIVKHVQKATNVAAPAAQAGGAAIGGAVNAGMAQGMNSSQTVVDTVTIKHTKHIIDIASDSLGVKSPSEEFDYIGRMAMAGFGQGIARGAAGSFGALGNVLDTHQAMTARIGQGGFGYDNTNTRATTVSMNRPSDSKDDDQSVRPPQAMQYSSPLANQNIDRHNRRMQDLARGREDSQRNAIGGMTHDERAQKLAQNRADLHAKAMANLGAINPQTGQKWQDPTKANVNPFAGQKAPSLWDSITKEGPVGDLRAQFAQHGQAIPQGVAVGIKKGTPAAQNQISQMANSVQTQHKKDNGISSPSTVYAADGVNMAAGVGVGFAAGTAGAVSAMTDAAAQMSNAIAGPLNNQGLMLGYSYATNVVNGATAVLKTANFQAASNANIANQQAAAAVGAIGLLGTGSGSSVYKTPSVAMTGGVAAQTEQMVSALAAAIQSQPIQMSVSLDGQPFHQMTAEALNRFVEQLRDSLGGANG